MNNKNKTWLVTAGILATSLALYAQNSDDDDVFELSPFAVDASEDVGYRATSTLAGSRVRSNIGDLGASISVITEEFMQDTGATDGESLLQFVGNMEVGGVLGNFSNVNTDSASTNESRVNPQRGQRVRGLASAILTRDYFQTDIPFDAYNTTRVDVNRGPNSILFGLGSPGGVINNSLKRAHIGSEDGEVSFRVGHRGTVRGTFDLSRTLIEDRLAVRLAGLKEDLKFKQKPAYEKDTRFFLAWDATLFKNENSNWLGRTSARGSFETGEIRRNPPDVVPPVDRFSSWWEGIGSQEDLHRLLSVPGVTLEEISNQALTEQQVLTAISAGYASVPLDWEGTLEDYAALEGQFVPRTTIDRFKRGDPYKGDPILGDTTEGGINSTVNTVPYFLFPSINFNSVNATTPGWDSPELDGIQGIMGRWRPKVLGKNQTQDVRWTNAATAGPGFGPATLSNRNVFDYHNLLFQGTTNYVNTDFDINQVFLEQELFEGRAGIELAFDKQVLEQEEFTPFEGGANKSIQIDITENLSPGDVNADGIADRLYNENLGRPVVDWDDNFTRFRRNEQDTIRATLFGTLDLSETLSNDTLGKILGKHTLTGLYEERNNENRNTEHRGSWWADTGKDPGSADISNGLSDNFRRIVKSQVYLGPDVRGLSSPDDVRIDGYLTVPFPQIGDEYGIWYFDNKLKTDVQNTWRVIRNEGIGNIRRWELESKAVSLQSTLLDGHVVALYAERTDEEYSYRRLQSTGYGAAGPDGALRIDLPGINEIDGSFNLDLMQLETEPAGYVKDDTSTKSLVVKFPEAYLFELPWGMDLQAHYYEADSFEPAGLYQNILGQPLASPTGVTEEMGFTLTMLDGKLSIRYNDFETISTNDRTGGMNGQLAQIANRFAFYLDRITSAENDTATTFLPGADDLLLTPDTIPSNRERKSGTDADLAGFTTWDEYYNAIINAIHPDIQAVRNFRVDTLENGDRVDDSNPLPDLNSTQDFVSTGKEIDIVGQVTRNITLALNVAQQKTVVSNIGPVAIPLAFAQAELLQRTLPNSPGGWSLWDLRDSPFQVERGTIGTRYDAVLREMRIQQGKDGKQSQEQREWRINLTGRYDFLEGPMKGLQVGGSLRYQDAIAGGYPNYLDDEGTILPDIDNPWMGPDDLTGDAFIRYRRKIMDGNMDWSVQLNARNLYRSEGDRDIPISFNPDGSVALARIPVEQQWFLTNTFNF